MAVNAENIMKRKELYTAPAILEEIELEMSGTILITSEELTADKNFDEVKTMGQDVNNDIQLVDWNQPQQW